MGYHIREIKKGVLGETSKIREELEELEDALEQNNKILALCELADLVGAIEAVTNKLGLMLEDVCSMMEATKSAFKDGTRS